MLLYQRAKTWQDCNTIASSGLFRNVEVSFLQEKTADRFVLSSELMQRRSVPLVAVPVVVAASQSRNFVVDDAGRETTQLF